MEDYLKIVVRKDWDTETVGVMLEAFAMAGCDFSGEYTLLTSPQDCVIDDRLRTPAMKMSSKEQADHLKREIRDKISGMLSKYLSIVYADSRVRRIDNNLHS